MGPVVVECCFQVAKLGVERLNDAQDSPAEAIPPKEQPCSQHETCRGSLIGAAPETSQRAHQDPDSQKSERNEEGPIQGLVDQPDEGKGEVGPARLGSFDSPGQVPVS